VHRDVRVLADDMGDVLPLGVHDLAEVRGGDGGDLLLPGGADPRRDAQRGALGGGRVERIAVGARARPVERPASGGRADRLVGAALAGPRRVDPEVLARARQREAMYAARRVAQRLEVDHALELRGARAGAEHVAELRAGHALRVGELAHEHDVVDRLRERDPALRDVLEARGLPRDAGVVDREADRIVVGDRRHATDGRCGELGDDLRFDRAARRRWWRRWRRGRRSDDRRRRRGAGRR